MAVEETQNQTPEASTAERGRRQVLSGTVVSDKMEKTITVAVERIIQHKLYKRYLKRTQRFAAHDEKNEAREGDRVTIVQTRPLSKRKRWRLQDIVERAQ